MTAPFPTLKTSPEFQRIAKLGKRWSAPAFFLQALPSDQDHLRIGYTASRKVGGAVMRNKAKRRIREMTRLCAECRAITGWDIVIVIKTAAASHDFEKMGQDFKRGLKSLGILS